MGLHCPAHWSGLFGSLFDLEGLIAREPSGSGAQTRRTREKGRPSLMVERDKQARSAERGEGWAETEARGWLELPRRLFRGSQPPMCKYADESVMLALRFAAFTFALSCAAVLAVSLVLAPNLEPAGTQCWPVLAILIGHKVFR